MWRQDVYRRIHRRTNALRMKYSSHTAPSRTAAGWEIGQQIDNHESPRTARSRSMRSSGSRRTTEGSQEFLALLYPLPP